MGGDGHRIDRLLPVECGEALEDEPPERLDVEMRVGRARQDGVGSLADRQLGRPGEVDQRELGVGLADVDHGHEAGRHRSLHVEDGGERHRDRLVVWLGLHDVGHVRPPAPHHRVVGQLGHAMAVGAPKHAEQRAGRLVEVDRVVADAGLPEKRRELRPDLVVAAPCTPRPCRD